MTQMSAFSEYDFLYSVTTVSIAISAILGTLVAILGVFPYEEINQKFNKLSMCLWELYKSSQQSDNEREYWKSKECLQRTLTVYKYVYIDLQKLLNKFKW